MPLDSSTDDTETRPAGDHALGRTTTTMVVALGLLVVFNAASLKNWTSQQPAGQATLFARQLAENWWATTTRLGLAAPRQAVADMWAAARNARWPGDPPTAAPAQR